MTASAITKPRTTRTRRSSTTTSSTRKRTTKKMNEPTKVIPIKDATPVVVPEVVTNKYPLTKPDVELLTTEILLADFKKRVAIHNYEVQEAWRDFHWVIDRINNQAKVVVNRVKEVSI